MEHNMHAIMCHEAAVREEFDLVFQFTHIHTLFWLLRVVEKDSNHFSRFYDPISLTHDFHKIILMIGQSILSHVYH